MGFRFGKKGLLRGYTEENGVTEIAIPNGVTEIGAKAFFGCKNITKIIIPDGVVKIGPYAFTGCTNLVYINIPESVVWISDSAFRWCDRLDKSILTSISAKKPNNNAQIQKDIEKNKLKGVKYMKPTLEDVCKFLAENEKKTADSINYASELLLSEIDQALESLKERRMEAVCDDDDDTYKLITAYRDIMNDYRENIEQYLNFATKNFETEDNESDLSDDHEIPKEIKNNDSDKIDYSKYSCDTDVPHMITEDFTFKKICAFSFDGVKFYVNTWREALVLLCNLLVKKYPNNFDKIQYDYRVGSASKYFVNRNISGKTVKIENSKLYVYVNLSADSIAKLMSQILKYFSYEIKQFKIYIRADYTTLHHVN